MCKEMREVLEDLAAIEARANEIRTVSETAEDVEKLSQMESELDEMEARKNELLAKKAELEAREAAVKEVEEGTTEAREIPLDKGEKHTMTLEEIRNSKEYTNAYAEYLKSGEDEEVRALLSEAITVSGTSGVPTPTYVEERIRTAWENNEILARVRKSFVKGNLKIGFEKSASDAVVHTEGAAAPAEETLTLGIVELVPETIKKWISVSDEVLDMHGEQFLDYLVDEIEYRLAKKAADLIVADITGSPTTATTSAASVANVSISAAAIADFVNAKAALSDEAANPVIIMNKASYATYKGLQMGANHAGVDPFDGMQVIFNNTLYPAASATTGQAIAIVGDLNGVQANFPNGYNAQFKIDDLSLAEKDLVKIVGRLPMGHDVVACGHFAVIKKA